MSFKTPEKSTLPSEFYEKLLWAPKAAEKCKPRAMFQDDGPLKAGDHSPISSRPKIEPICFDHHLEKGEPQIPPSPPRKSLSPKFFEQILQAPKRPAFSSTQKRHGRFSLPVSSKISKKQIQKPNRSCIIFSL